MPDDNVIYLRRKETETAARTPLAELDRMDLREKFAYAGELADALTAAANAFITAHGVGADHPVVGMAVGQFAAVVASFDGELHRECILSNLDAVDPVEVASFTEARLSRDVNARAADDVAWAVAAAIAEGGRKRKAEGKSGWSDDETILGLTQVIQTLTDESTGKRRDVANILLEISPAQKAG
jgi:hypothetical protein